MLGYIVIKKDHYDDLKEQIRQTNFIEKDAKKTIKDLENVRDRKNATINELTKKIKTRDSIILNDGKYKRILEKNNDELLQEVSHYRVNDEELHQNLKKLKEENSKLKSDYNTLFARVGGLTKANKDLENKIKNYKEHYKNEHIQRKPSEYDQRIKTVAQKKKEVATN